jgi:hypothetical protein
MYAITKINGNIAKRHLNNHGTGEIIHMVIHAESQRAMQQNIDQFSRPRDNFGMASV